MNLSIYFAFQYMNARHPVRCTGSPGLSHVFDALYKHCVVMVGMLLSITFDVKSCRRNAVSGACNKGLKQVYESLTII